MLITTDKLNYRGQNRLDISFATGDLFYAPSWSMHCDYKNKKIDIKTFKKLYLNLMKNRFDNSRMRWKLTGLLKKKKIVFCVGENEIHHRWLENLIKKELKKLKEI